MDLLGLSSGELTVHLLEGCAWLAAAWVGLKIKDFGNKILLGQADMDKRITENQNRIERNLTEKQTELRRDFDEKHAENSQKIAVHETRDDERFGHLATMLQRVEKKIDDNRGRRL